jgi:transcriptional regulator GlxA family with amidase domain
MPHRVVVLALDGVLPFDLGIPERVFHEARDALGRRLYEVSTCSLGGRAIRTSHDFTIVVDNGEEVLADADTVVIATQEPTPELLTTGRVPSALTAALALVRPDARIVTLCTSAFVLAATGLLDGLKATTHWALCADFARLFPLVAVDPDVLFVDNGRLLTSAGGAAGIDMCLHLVRRDHGADVANAAARYCVVAPWRHGGQAQFIEHPLREDTDNSTTRTREWLLRHLADPLSLADLAGHAHMSVRTFTRRFHAEVGESPLQWINQRRVEHARRLLETTDLTVHQVVLRKHLNTRVGLSPGAYRRVYRVPAGSMTEAG